MSKNSQKVMIMNITMTSSKLATIGLIKPPKVIFSATEYLVKKVKIIEKKEDNPNFHQKVLLKL